MLPFHFSHRPVLRMREEAVLGPTLTCCHDRSYSLGSFQPGVNALWKVTCETETTNTATRHTESGKCKQRSLNHIRYLKYLSAVAWSMPRGLGCSDSIGFPALSLKMSFLKPSRRENSYLSVIRNMRYSLPTFSPSLISVWLFLFLLSSFSASSSYSSSSSNIFFS